MDQHEGLVPSIWPAEVANGLLAAARRGRIDDAGTRSFLQSLKALPITVDGEALARVGEWLSIAGRHNLSAYDAAYLELAMRHSATLATLDRALARAARAQDVPVVGLGE